jgi:hypothetical protein
MLSSFVFQSKKLLHLGLLSQRELARPSVSTYLESIGCLVRIHLGWYTPICYTLDLGWTSDDFEDLFLRHPLKWVRGACLGVIHRSSLWRGSRAGRACARRFGSGVTSDGRRESREMCSWLFFRFPPRQSLPFPFWFPVPFDGS